MPDIAIYADSRGKDRCRSCGAPIEWAEVVASGKRMPFDRELVVVRTEGNPITGRVIEHVDTSISASHFATCPDAQDWRGRKR